MVTRLAALRVRGRVQVWGPRKTLEVGGAGPSHGVPGESRRAVPRSQAEADFTQGQPGERVALRLALKKWVRMEHRHQES